MGLRDVEPIVVDLVRRRRVTEGSREPRASVVSRVSVPRRELLVAVLAVAIGATALAGSAFGVLPACTDPAWGCQLAHDPPGFAGSNTAIAFDPAGDAWVSFRDQDAQALMVARYVGEGGDCVCNPAWTCTVVDDPGGQGVGFETDIAFTGGTAWVSYYDRTKGALKVAVLQGAPTGGSAPVVTGFSPTSGPVGTGVTISGSNLTGATAVMFGGIFAAFPVPSDTQITATVPGGAKTGPITAVTPAGSATSSQSFRVTKR